MLNFGRPGRGAARVLYKYQLVRLVYTIFNAKTEAFESIE